MSDETPAESYTAEEIDQVRAKIRAALEEVDAMIAMRRYWIQGESWPGWSPGS